MGAGTFILAWAGFVVASNATFPYPGGDRQRPSRYSSFLVVVTRISIYPFAGYTVRHCNGTYDNFTPIHNKCPYQHARSYPHDDSFTICRGPARDRLCGRL